MPPASQKDCSVILFDLAAKPRERAIQALLKICCYKFFTQSKDLTKVVLLNSRRTENCLNARHNGYTNIYEVTKDVTSYNPKFIMELIEENSETGDANWLEGLQVAIRYLDEDFAYIRGVITHQLLFITDLKTPLQRSDDAAIDKIASGLNKLKAFLYVVGPEVEVPFTVKNPAHVTSWMKDLAVDEKDENLVILKKIISSTENSLVCDYTLGVNLFFSYKNWGGSQPWQVPLAVGTQIEIPAQTLKVLDENIPCKLTSAAGAVRAPLWVDAEDESIEFDSFDIVRGIERHNKFVPIPDNKIFRVQSTRGFSVLCFTDGANVPEHLMRGGGCYCVVPNSTPRRNQALHILIDCLAKQNKYVIARRVYNSNYVPKIVALIPQPDHNPKCFLLTSLPFADDVRVNYKERRVESAPRDQISEATYQFLAGLDTDDPKTQTKLPLSITMTQSTNVMKIVNKGADKLTDKHLRLDDLDMNLLETSGGETHDALRSLWPKRVISEKTSKEDDSLSDDDFDW